ncbi:Flagellar P-ring protein OS=Stutzerimonas stutzeri OX=316 GN=flgI PE=3 SV=1 [Stutzerimonas stutzeri]
MRPKVVFNSRTGTVVVGEGVRVKAAAAARIRTLTVTISERPAGQPAGAVLPGRDRRGAAVGRRRRAGPQRHVQVAEGASLESIISTINSLGATPDDVMSILQSLERAGALNAELIVI